MKPIFDKKDFSLCEVPVPKGYPQSQTHTGVGQLGDIIVLTKSPYPSVKRNVVVSYLRAAIGKLFNYQKFKKPGEFYENPCIYIGKKKGNDFPTEFKLAQERPLEESLEPVFGMPSFNSDPDLYIEGETVYVLNRSIYRRSNKKFDYFMRLFLFEGRIVNEKFLLYNKSLFKEGTDIVGSQCLCKYKDKYILTDVVSNSYNDGETFSGIRMLKGETMQELSSSNTWEYVTVDRGQYLPWHMSLFIYDNRLYTIIACVEDGKPQRCWQLLGVFSEDLSKLKIYQTPLTDYSSYRGSAIVDKDGEFIIYNTTVREKIKGSKSVDGRDVIMAHMPMNDLITKLESENQ